MSLVIVSLVITLFRHPMTNDPMTQ